MGQLANLPQIPDLDEGIVSRLPSPFNLIAEWLRYTSWESMAESKFLAVYMSNETEHGQRLTWTERDEYGKVALKRFFIPLDLYERTDLHLRGSFNDRVDEHGNFPWHMWVVGRTPITYDDLLSEIMKVVGN